MSKPTEELRRQIVADINAGAPGAKLGSERDLAERYATSRSSLRQVLAALEEAGLVNRVIGRAGGIFISHGQIQRSLSDVVGVPAFLASQGYVAGTRVLSTKISPPDRTAQKALRLDGSAFIIEIQRLRLADGSPISLELAQFPADAFPGLLEQQLGGSIYQILEDLYGKVLESGLLVLEAHSLYHRYPPTPTFADGLVQAQSGPEYSWQRQRDVTPETAKPRP